MMQCEELLMALSSREQPFTPKKNNKILVSIIVLNRNGLGHLKTLIPALLMNTCGIKYELILVDNASSDSSVAYVQNKFKEHGSIIPLQLIQNKINQTFSVANNKAAAVAKGKYLVLLNNDIEPLAGWLNYLLQCIETEHGVGSVGARLVYPYRKPSRFINPFKKKNSNSCFIQHAGIAFENEGLRFRPYNMGKGKDINDPKVLKSGNRGALTAACLLVPKDIYIQVGGLDESYNYGGEDVDFGLKLLKAGYRNYYCADSVLFHHEFGTQSKEQNEHAAKRRQANQDYFQKKWFLSIKKAYWAEKITRSSKLYAESPLTIAILDGSVLNISEIALGVSQFGWKAICITKKQLKKKAVYFDFILSKTDKDKFEIIGDHFSTNMEPDNWQKTFIEALQRQFIHPSIVIKIPAKTWEGAYSWGDYHLAVLLKQQLEKRGHFVLLQVFPEWDNDEGMEFDVALVLRGVSRYRVKAHQVNIMWNISHPDDVSLEEYEEYDKVFIASKLWTDQVAKKISVPVETMLQCTDPSRFFEPTKEKKSQYHHPLLFVGNSRGVYRKILQDLIPTNYDLAVYGRKWNKLIPSKYIREEHIPNDQLYLYYGAADILLNDHWDDMREQGFVSNRIFDGLACGAFIITDRVQGMGKLEKYMQVYDSKAELGQYIETYLNNPEKRNKTALAGKEYVIKNHTFSQRAKQLSESITQLISQKESRNG